MSWILAVASLKKEDTTWTGQYFPDVQSAVYVVDDSTAMVYLTYIIDHYHSLPDVCTFVHASRFADHNEEIFSQDIVKIIGYLHVEHVTRTGYMNLRCQWDHGCPIKHNLDDIKHLRTENETRILYQAWTELFQRRPVPKIVAQPWGGQFAASRERIRSIPLEDWIRYRQWLLDTTLHDYDSGRVWEYTWQLIPTDSPVFCPAMDICYCEGYGVCFASEDEFRKWWNLHAQSKDLYSQYLLI